ncbi:cytochrome P450 [Aspergillus californicus]
MTPLVATGLFLLVLVYFVGRYSDIKGSKIPVVSLCRWLPDFANRLLYFFNGPALIHEGYKKYKDVPFYILKPDADMIVLPAKYLKEIRSLPGTTISLIDAQFDSICGDYLNILSDSNLSAHTVSKKLTPAIPRIVPKIVNELEHAFDVEVPECNGRWTSVYLYHMILKLINRSTSRIVVGDVLCRNEDWLNIVLDYSHDLAIVMMIIRPFPKLLRPYIAKLLPSVRRLKQTFKRAEDIFVPMIIERREAEASNPNFKKPDDFMQWMMDSADNEYDRKPENIAKGLMIIQVLGIVHTSTMLITQSLYDLIIRPEYLAPLRLEIMDSLSSGWAKATSPRLASQRRLDSFLRESQRLTPTSEINVQRFVREPIIFSDGFVLPKGALICFASGPIALDPAFVSNPETFDGFRWETSSRTSLVAVSDTHLHFGYGRSACPGRMFGSYASKAILSRFIVEYDMKFEEGKEGKRPMNFRNGEQIFPNVLTKVLIRKTGVSA